MKHITKMIVAVVFAGAAFACQTKEKPADTNEAAAEANDEKFQTQKAEEDADFIAHAVASNYAEIELAQIGIQRSDNKQIKEVGRMLEEHHNKLLRDLQALATKKAISIPSASEDKDRSTIDDLNKESEIKDFNKEWCKELVSKHEKSIKDFEERLAKTDDPDIKNLVNEALPQLRTHLEQVKACHEKIAEAK